MILYHLPPTYYMCSGCGLPSCKQYVWVLWSFYMTREVYCSHPWIQTTEIPNAGHFLVNSSQYQNGAYLKKSLPHLHQCLHPDPMGPWEISSIPPLLLPMTTSMDAPKFFSSLSPARFVCIPHQYFWDSFPGKHGLTGHKPAANSRCHSCGG